MSEIPEVFAIFEQKLAHVLSFTLREKGQKKAIEELLVYFSGIVERASKAESRAEKAEAMVERLIDAGQKVHFISEQIAPVNVEPLRKWRALVAEWRKEREND